MEPPPRRRRRLLLLLLALSALPVTAGSAEARLIANGSFEHGLSPWTATDSSLRIVSGGKVGRMAVRVPPAAPGARLCGLPRGGPLAGPPPNRLYRVSGWLRAAPDTTVCLAVRERDGRERVGSGARCLRADRHWRLATVWYRALGDGRVDLLVFASRAGRHQRFGVDGVSLSQASGTRTLFAKQAKRVPPTSVATPAVSGSPVVGETLTGTSGAWVGPGPITYSYQWRRCHAAGESCTDIFGAVGPSYVVTPADAGATLRLVVTARNAYGSASATSAPAGPVTNPQAAPPPPPPPPPPPTTTRPDVGVNFHCTWSDYTDQERARVLDELRDAGVRWVRIDVGWASLQEVARYQLSQWYVDVVDRCVDMARARGINVLGMLWQTPAWANGGKGVMVPPLDPADYAWIAHWAAAHFRGRIAAWEIWNEPDPAQASWAWSGTVTQYVNLLQAAYPAIKSADPDATVVFGGPSWNDTAFISSAYAVGARGAFDVMAVHEYQAVADAPPEYVGDSQTWWFPRASAVHDVMAANGDGDKAIWFTEFGWSSHETAADAPNWQRGVTLAQQGDYLVRAVEYARLHFPYVTKMFWYDERNHTGTDVQNANFGLLDHDLVPKPAYTALKSYLTG